MRLALVKRLINALSDPDDLVLGLAPDFPDTGFLYAIVIVVVVLAKLIRRVPIGIARGFLEALAHGLLVEPRALCNLVHLLPVPCWICKEILAVRMIDADP